MQIRTVQRKSLFFDAVLAETFRLSNSFLSSPHYSVKVFVAQSFNAAKAISRVRQVTVLLCSEPFVRLRLPVTSSEGQPHTPSGAMWPHPTSPTDLVPKLVVCLFTTPNDFRLNR